MSQSDSQILRTEAEGFELSAPYLIEFLRQADEIRMPTLCHQNEDGSLVVIERQLIATIKRSDEAVCERQRSSS